MNNQEKHLLNIYLRLDYYKKDIIDMYSLTTTNVVLDNHVLDNIKDKLYITTFDKHIKLQQENKQLKQQFDKYKKKITPLKMLQQLEVLEQENQELKEDISFCLHSIKQEMEMSTDSRTRNEMTSCYEILKRWNK